MKKKILLIDDEEDFSQLVKMNLEEIGEYEVKTENRGINALKVAKEFKPDIILLDIVMADIGGGEIANKLENEKETKEIPIIFLSAIIDEKDTKDTGGLLAGHPLVAKPVSIERLIKVIEENLKKK
jgi:CheY-like chemotaxis protein